MAKQASQLLSATISIAGAALAGPAGALLGKLAGSLLEASLPGLGGFLGSISSNLATDALKAASRQIVDRLTPPEKQRINHDLQTAFQDACREALFDIGGKECFPEAWETRPREAPEAVQFPRTPAGRRLWHSRSPLAGQVAELLQRMEREIRSQALIPVDPPAGRPAAGVDLYLAARTPEALNGAFYEQVVAPFLAGYGSLRREVPELEQHLERHLLDRALVHLGELLKQRTPAWRAFNRAVLAELRDQLAALGAGQAELLARLDALNPPQNDGQVADRLAELLAAYGQMEKDFTHGLDDLSAQAVAFHQAEMERLEILAAASLRIENKVERVLRFLEDGKWVIEGPAPAGSDLAPEPGEPPFKGMRYFEEQDAGLFFGRERLAARLACLLADRPVLVVTGASGSGKSSLVRAGLIPALRGGELLADGSFPPAGADRWPVFLMTPTSYPLEALASCLARESEALRAASALAEDLRADPHSLELYARRLVDPADSSQRVLLVVDQFEELFTLCRDPAERQAFVDALLAPAARGSGSLLRVVLTLRADFYASCAQYPALREVLSKWQEYIGPMEPAEIRRAIEEPARLGGWSFEPGLVELILHDIGAEGTHPPEPGALPLLSHALLETWKHRRGREMTLESYAESGGVRQAIAHTAESVYQGRLDPAQRATARRIFLRLTELGEGTQDTRRRARLDELSTGAADSQAVTAVLSVLTEARLVTAAEDTVEVAHEALIREWPTLQQWLEEDRESIRVHRRLTEAAEEWRRGGQDEGLLYRGARLAEAAEWAQQHGADLNAGESAFLEASQALHRSELEMARRRAEEQALVAARMRRRSVYLAGALAFAALLAVMAVWFWLRADDSAREALHQQQTAEASSAEALFQKWQADRQRLLAEQEKERAEQAAELARLENEKRAAAEQEAQRQAEIATSNSLVIQARSFAETRHALALLMSLHANRLVDSPAAQVGLFDHLRLYPNVLRYFYYKPLSYPDTVGDMAFSPDNTLFAILQDVETPARVKIWDVRTGALLQDVQLEDEKEKQFHCCYAMFFPDNQSLALLSFDANYSIDPASGAITKRQLPENHDPVVFSPDKTTFVTISNRTELNVWDYKTWTILRRFSLVPPETGELAVRPNFLSPRLISPDNRTVVLEEYTGQNFTPIRLRLVSLETGSEIAAFASRGTKLAIDPTGAFLAVGDRDQTQVLNLKTMEIVQTFETCAWNQLIFFDADTLICNDTTNLNFWNTQSGDREYTIRGGQNRWSGGLLINSDRTLGAFALDDSVALLDLSRGSESLSAAWLDDAVAGVGFSPDSRTVYALSRNGMAASTDLRTLKHQSFTSQAYSVVAFHWPNAVSPDGAFFAGFTEDRRLDLVDLQTGEKLAEQETGFAENDAIVDFSINVAKGRIAVLTKENRLWIWDYHNRQVVLDMTVEVEADFGAWSNAVEFHPGGDQVAVGLYDVVNVLDIPSRKWLFQTKHEHTDDIMNITYSPDGKTIASCSSDGSIVLWDSQTGRQVGKTILSDNIISLAFSPDGRILASGSWGSNQVVLWDVQTGQPIGEPLGGHGAKVTHVQFSPNGRYLVSADMNGSTIVWDLGLDALRARACYIANREVYDEEWGQFFGGLARANACSPSASADVENGWWLFQQGQYDLALSAFDRAVTQDASAGEAYLGQGWAYTKLRQYEMAITAFEKGLAVDPQDAGLYDGLGGAHYLLDHPAEAIMNLERAIALDERYDNSVNLVRLGWSNNYLGKYDQAIAYFERSLQKSPQANPAHQGLGDAYYATGQMEKALEHYRTYLELAKENAAAYVVERVRELEK